MNFNSELESAPRIPLKVSPKTQRKTPVILVCIFSEGSHIISHDFLHSLFSPYGNIQRILIFEKTKKWKSFIEFSNSSEAINALKFMNNKTLFDDVTKL
jgi:RNA recognition motif-containing protein